MTGIALQVDMYSFGVILWELITTEMARRGRLRAIQVCITARLCCATRGADLHIAQLNPACQAAL